MMKKISIVAGLILWILFFALALFALNDAKIFTNDKLYFVCEDTPITGFDAYTIQKKEIQADDNRRSFTFWGSKIASVSSEFGVADSVPVIMVSGRTDLLFPNSPVLDYDMQSQCLIGDKTAQRLFGVSNAVGLSIVTDGNKYTIAGILNGVGDVLVYETARETDTGLNQIVLLCNSFGGKEFALFGYDSLPVPVKLLDYDTILWILEILIIVIPFLVLFSLLSFRKYLIADTWINRLVWSIMALVGCAVFVIVAINYVNYPADMIPSEWSDFSFFGELLHTKVDNMARLIRQPILPTNYTIFFSFVKAVLFIWLSVTIYAINVLSRKRPLRTGGKQ